ncbi:uncharacterized protein [Chiloscyllium punctatum]|uniref:uncharacterized protein n=1 Tax=Chiloscyllium punctatum TaxID=137246 RepID=UPI003B631D43
MMSPVSGESLQLVYIQEDVLLLNEEAFKRCFLRGDVKDGPVCLISIIGEERKGKSFLLNYLLRRLCHLECKDQGWMGKSNEDLKGFEYRPGRHSTTKGVFVWSEPFLIDSEHGKMAVFLVDTEGCDGHERKKSISVQLSALSMLLSSYMIFNVASKINQTDLEYLEMFLDMAQQVGEVLDLDPIQHLDILVRDWEWSENYGKESGKEYLLETKKAIQNSESELSAPLMKQLSECDCFLLPNPGKKIRISTTGRWNDMSEDFKNSLDDYASSVLRSLPTSARTANKGSVVSGFKFFERMKLFTKTIERYSKHITTPLQMMNAIQGLKLREKMLKDFQNLFPCSEVDDDDISVILKTSPMSMRNRLELKAKELVEKFKQQLEVGEEQRESEVTELDKLLKKDTENFCKAYTTKYNTAICKLREKMVKEFECFIEQQEVDDDDISVILKTSPMSMRNRLKPKAKELVEEFKQQLEVGEEQRESEVTELDKLLKKDTENFCKAYTTKYNWAIGKLRQTLLKEFECFIEQQEVDDDDISVILKTSPMSMRNRLKLKAKELVEKFKQQLEVGEEQRESEVTELDKLLKKDTENFCKAYTTKYNTAIGKLREKMVKEFECFIEQQEVDDDDISVILKTSPMSMRNRLKLKAKELVEKFKQQLEVGEEQRESEVTELDKLLKKDTENFCKAYMTKYNWTIGKLTQMLLKEFECFIEQQEVDDDDISVILKTSPMSMRNRLKLKAKELVEKFKQQLEVGEEQRESEVTELDKLLKKDTENFCKAYTTKYNWAIGNLRQMLLKEFECFIEQQEVDDDDISVILKASPMSMRNRLKPKAKELVEKFKQQLEVGEEQRESEVTELDKLLKKDTENFCKAYTTKYNTAIGKLREKMVKQLKCFTKQQQQDNKDILKITPASMREYLDKKADELIQDFRSHLLRSEEDGESEGESEKEVTELKEHLTEMIEKFCISYRNTFTSAIEKLRQEKLKEFESFINQQQQDNKDILKITPASMRECLDKKADELTQDFRSHLLRSEEDGESEGESETEVTELKEHLTEMIEKFYRLYGNTFTSAIEKLRQEKLKEFESFINQQEVDDDDISVILKTSPMSMRNRLKPKAKELVEKFKQQLEVGEEQRESEVTELDKLLKKDTENFCKAYTTKYNTAIGKLREKMVKEFECFIEQQEVDDDDISVILKTSPMSMRNRLKLKAKELVEKFKQQLEVGVEQRESEVTELDKLLKKDTENFCKAYTTKYNTAIGKLTQMLLKEFEGFIKQQEVDDDDISVILKASPMSMRNRLKPKAKELMEKFKQQLEVGEEQRESEVTELDKLLKKDSENFCKAYTTKYNTAIGKLTQMLLKEFEGFIKQQEVDDDDISVILKASPMSMRNRLKPKAKELVEKFKQQLEVGEEQRESEVTELDKLLKKDTENFCKAYTTKYNTAIGKLREKMVKEFECFIEQQEVDDDDISVILKTSPMSMRNRLKPKAKELVEKFKQQLEVGEEQRESEVTELDKLLKKDTENFCKAYTTKYNTAIGKLTQMLLKEFEGFIKQQEVDDDDISVILKTSPMSMRNRLKLKAKELVEKFKQQLEVGEEQRESEVTELDKLLKKDTENFCKAYTTKYNWAIGNLREKMVKQLKCFTKQQHRDNEDVVLILKTTPASMRKCLDEKACELIRDFQSHLLMSEGEREKEGTELKECLNEMIENFCISYGNTFTSIVEKRRQRKLKEFESFINQQQQDNKDILKINPASMREYLDKKADELTQDFRSHLLKSEEDGESEGESEKEVTELKEHLTEMIEKFYRLYGNTFTSAIEKLRQEKLKEFESFINQQERYVDIKSKILKNNPDSMNNVLRQQAKKLMKDFSCSLGKSEHEVKETVAELEAGMQEQLRKHLEIYTESFLNVVEVRKGDKLNDFRLHVKQQDFIDDDKLLRNSPSSVSNLVDMKLCELCQEFEKFLNKYKGNDRTDLKRKLQEERKTFLNTYQTKFNQAVLRQINEKVEDLCGYFKEKTDSRWQRMITRANTMREILETKAKELTAVFERSVCGNEEEMIKALASMETEMKKKVKYLSEQFDKKHGHVWPALGTAVLGGIVAGGAVLVAPVVIGGAAVTAAVAAGVGAAGAGTGYTLGWNAAETLDKNK